MPQFIVVLMPLATVCGTYREVELRSRRLKAAGGGRSCELVVFAQVLLIDAVHEAQDSAKMEISGELQNLGIGASGLVQVPGASGMC